MNAYKRPEFLNHIVDQSVYERWLDRKARSHVKRDKHRGNLNARLSEYKRAIHEAVHKSNGRDAYTDEYLNWSLISTYDNLESKKYRREYKKRYALLPTVDHIGDGMGAPEFKICAWRTNDAKSDLSFDEFFQLCKKVVNSHESGFKRSD